jgi:hypothetical protein
LTIHLSEDNKTRSLEISTPIWLRFSNKVPGQISIGHEQDFPATGFANPRL